ncbi:hypothetical protein H3Z83_07660 [Tenacibaculum sp. S7007]|uniref:Bacteriocin n=1 Tax=Tenacibaculum pelagium TaxID=2759527 RepID=A0A839APV8_9FLAO|nr:hypothetical protein [Tenacibaculum pelagium]MBA6156388.1 hypothetical protein [Tenacibaculum pelagium]
MKKQILNLGKVLNKVAQKEISGGKVGGQCRTARDCWHATGGIGSINDYLCTNGHCTFSPNPF